MIKLAAFPHFLWGGGYPPSEKKIRKAVFDGLPYAMKYIVHHHIHAVSSSCKEQVIFIDNVKNQENEQTDIQLLRMASKEKKSCKF